MTTTQLSLQLTQDALMFNAVSAGVNNTLSGALAWGGLTYAEYAMTLSGLAPMAGTNEAGFIGAVYENALGRAPDAQEVAFYEAVMAGNPNGAAQVVEYIGLSPESWGRNHGLAYHV